MQVLVLAAPRSGIGRTTLVYRLARLVERADAGPVVLLDADPDQELTRRCAEAGESDLIVLPWDASCTGPEFLNLKAKGSGLIIIDAPPPEQPETLSQVLSVADLVAVVARPLEDDFALLGKMIDIIESAAKPFLFVVNRAKRHGNMAAATAIALAQYDAVCPVILPEDERVAPSLRAKVFGKKKQRDGELKLEQFWTYLSGRLETAAAETAVLAGEALVEGRLERRSFPRQSFDIGATFIWARQVYPCQIQNISASGLAFTADVPLPLGARLKLQIPYLGEFEAEPVRSDGNTVGLRFVIDEWQQAGLVRDLTALVNSGRSAVKLAKPVRMLDSDTRDTPTMSPAIAEEAVQEGKSTGAEDGKEKAPLELTQTVTEDGAVVKLNTAQGHLAEKDRAALQKIIKRVNLQTGTLGEEQEQANTSPDPDAAPEENKRAKDRAASVRRHA